jgi:hypothetical protein
MGAQIGKQLATTRINFYSSESSPHGRKLLAYGSHTKAVKDAWAAAGGVSRFGIQVASDRSAVIEIAAHRRLPVIFPSASQRLVKYSEDGETVIG